MPGRASFDLLPDLDRVGARLELAKGPGPASNTDPVPGRWSQDRIADCTVVLFLLDRWGPTSGAEASVTIWPYSFLASRGSPMSSRGRLGSGGRHEALVQTNLIPGNDRSAQKPPGSGSRLFGISPGAAKILGGGQRLLSAPPSRRRASVCTPFALPVQFLEPNCEKRSCTFYICVGPIEIRERPPLGALC